MTKQCENKAISSYQWGGQGELKYCCEGHQNGLQQLSSMMGWPQAFNTVRADSELQCTSQVDEKEPTDGD